MSKYSVCKNCFKKGWHTVYGYDPNPEKGPMERCKYCQHSVRVWLVNRYPDVVYTPATLALYLDVPVGQVQKDIRAMKIRGRELAGTRIFTPAEARAYRDGFDPGEVEIQPILHSVDSAARDLGISVRRIRTAIANGNLRTMQVPAPGRAGWAHIFTQLELEAIVHKFAKVKPGPDPKDNIDKRLVLVNGRWTILGTRNRHGRPFGYKDKNQARRRAREAYGESLFWTEGKVVMVRFADPEARKMHFDGLAECVLLDDATWIDHLARIYAPEPFEKEMLVPVDQLIAIVESENEVRMTT